MEITRLLGGGGHRKSPCTPSLLSSGRTRAKLQRTQGWNLRLGEGQRLVGGVVSWNGAGFPPMERQLKEGNPSLSRGLGEGHRAPGGRRRKGHPVGTREFQQAEENHYCAYGHSSSLALRERAGSF